MVERGKIMRILAIGNSFSQNATTYLNSLFEFYGDDIFVANLYIPGCSLKEHADNLKTDEKVYEYQLDGVCQYKIDLKSAIDEGWDFITLQQSSGESGVKESYEPYFNDLISYLKDNAPDSQIVFHKTWSYENTVEHPKFVNYNHSQSQMDEMIDEVADYIKKEYKLPVLDTADVIRKARIDERTKDLKLSLDGYHLNTEFGQLLAAYSWYYFFSDKNINFTRPDFFPHIISENITFAIMEIAYQTIKL